MEDIDDIEEIDDSFDIEVDEDDPYLEDDQVMLEYDNQELDDDDIYEQLSRRKSSYADNYNPSHSFTDDIVRNESGGNYRAFNPAGGGEGAVGKYQFRWSAHKDKIRDFAGNENLTREDFMDNPQLQDAFYEKEWIPNHLEKEARQIKKQGLSGGLSQSQLYKLIHFRGKQGATDYLQGRVPNKPEAYNSSITDYIGMQTGGELQPKTYKPIKTDFKDIPTINPISPDVPQDSGFDKFIKGIDFGGIATSIDKGIQTASKIGNGIASNIGNGIDMAEQFTSSQIQNQQFRKQMQQLYGDDPSNYAPVTQRINNNPILS